MMNKDADEANTTELVVEEDKALSPWMIGLLLVMFGFLGFFTMGMNLYMGLADIGGVRGTWEGMGMRMEYIYVTFSIGMLATTWMMVIGVLLVRYRDSGRRQYNGYFIYVLVSTLLSLVYQYVVLPDGFGRQAALNGMMITVAGNLLIVAVFAFFRYLLNKEQTKACLT